MEKSNYCRRLFLTFFTFLFLLVSVQGQQKVTAKGDTALVEKKVSFKMDTVKISDSTSLPLDTMELEPVYRLIPRSPKKASIMSALVPGLGQIYNHKYWKLPLIYGGFAAMTYGFMWNNNQYKDYKEGYMLLSKGYGNLSSEEQAFLAQLIRNPNYNLQDPQNQQDLQRSLESGMSYYKRNRDLNVVGMAALYLLNIIDASIDAHFSTFDISDNLSMDVQPYATPDQMGVGVQLKF
ncbi:hypothetical protein K4L44_13370 [Halosquirtibacter laminarini]|uniref:Uncharacterized protein n=1 Tax=Halosquirtibacter laminarini TaxID=3374600 RepID=A0AC61NNU7_9BACT|nr:hypothetical protein K4L44_13370 [Prolixibacteraceae bacterium]